MLNLAGPGLLKERHLEALEPGWDSCKGQVGGMCIELELLERSSLWSSGKKGWSLDKEQTSENLTSLGQHGCKAKRGG